jgi:hypothetical protein
MCGCVCVCKKRCHHCTIMQRVSGPASRAQPPKLASSEVSATWARTDDEITESEKSQPTPLRFPLDSSGAPLCVRFPFLPPPHSISSLPPYASRKCALSFAFLVILFSLLLLLQMYRTVKSTDKPATTSSGKQIASINYTVICALSNPLQV